MVLASYVVLLRLLLYALRGAGDVVLGCSEC
jgi:hypothetical protein